MINIFLGNACAILSDPKDRKKYDLYGSDEEKATTHHHYHGESFTRGFESDATAEELFNMFFGGGMPSGQNIYFRTRNGRWHRQTEHHRHREVMIYDYLFL